MKPYFGRMSLDMVGEISFGYPFNAQTTELNPLLSALVKGSEGVVSFKAQTILAFLSFMWYMPFGPAKTLRDVNKTADKVLDEVSVQSV